MISSSAVTVKRSNTTGITVREIVERHPEQVSEVWCRKIFRHLLQSLERQYVMQLPHRTITPDTVIFRDDGAPLLLPSLISDPDSDIADDLTALAKLMHYAITREVLAVRPLRGRGLEGYSDSLLRAIDCSLAADPTKRPHTVAELRDILGIVVCGRSSTARTPARGTQPQLPEPAKPRTWRATDHPRRIRRPVWAWAGACLVILLLAGLAIVDDMRRSPSFDDLAVTLTAPRAGPSTPPDAGIPVKRAPVVHEPAPPVAGGAVRMAESGRDDPDDTGTAPPGTRSPAGHAKPREPPPPATPTPTTAFAPRAQASPPTSLPAPTPAPRPAPPPVAAPVPPPALAASAPARAGAGYTLRIRPWGVVRVDGVKRGVSPPLKRLVLAPGRHSILISNPGASERALEVDTREGDADIAVDFDSGPP